MSQNDDDSPNQGQEQQSSKLPKPASVNHYFSKIQANPKLWQFEAKIKPNPSDKNTKFTFKTNNKRFLDWSWINNSKMKFETKEGKTKLTISTKMFDGFQRSSKDRSDQKQISMRNHSSQKQKQDKPKEKDKDKDESNRNKDNNNGDIDVNFSTSFDDSKINIKLKDRGQINFKFNQAINLIPSTLTSNIQYIWEYKNKNDVHKYSAQLMYTSGVARWIYQRGSFGFNKGQNLIPVQPLLGYHKNETKMKAKISNHSDTEFKITSINHFGQISQKPLEPQSKEKQKKSEPQEKTESDLEQTEVTQKVQSGGSQPQTEILKTKVQLQNKITIFKKQADGFNFKTSLNCQHTALKQSMKIQTIVNHSGLHNIQTRYICKRWSSIIFGGMFGLNWNTHASQWHKKWQAIIQKQQFYSLGNIAFSLSDKYAGVRLSKKLTKNSKIEIMASRKWNLRMKDIPNIGIKINMNW